MVADIADEQAAFRVEGDAVRLAQLRLGGGTAIAREARRAGTRDRGDDPRFCVHATHHMILHLGEKHVAAAVEAHFVRFVEYGIQGGASIARVALLSAAGYRADAVGLQVQAADAVVADLAEIQRAVRACRQAVGIVDLRLRTRSSVAGESRGARAGDGDGGLAGREARRR